jgi:subtilase family serine protease
MSPDTRKFLVVVFASLTVLLIAIPAFAQSANGSRAQILGAESPSMQLNVTFWLKQHDKAALDEMVRQMYDRNSSSYHHWLTLKEYQTRFAPSAADMAVVRQHLAANHLSVVYVDKLNHAVTARGTVADIERATGVQLNRVLINGETHRLPSGEPAIAGDAGKLVYAVQGLTDTAFKSHAKRALDPDTGKPIAFTPLSKLGPEVGPAQQYFNADCLRTTQARTFKTGGGGPYAVYKGARYGGPITAGPPNLPPCGYTAPQVEKAYGLTSLYKQKLDGTGQTIVIVDAYGSDTITSDANIFSEINGLPALTPSNFAIYYPGGPTNCGGNTCGWDVETSLDVEWSHSVAPGANIALVLGLTNNSGDLDIAVLYALEDGPNGYPLGSVISNSYGIEEAYLATYDPAELIIENAINETGAALGVSVNFSSGDDGDFSFAYGATTVSMPGSSPYATSVGGTSLFLNGDRSIKLQTGWGNNFSRIALATPNPPIIPPLLLGFSGGSGGGASGSWSKPAYQESLSGNWRLVPDIAYLADPYTGAEFIDTEGGETFISVVGGTSLACPMFSANWAIAAQAAGAWPGQASALVYGLPSDAITDVTNVDGPNNVSGVIYQPKTPPVIETPQDLVPPLENTTDFMSLLYNGTSTRWYVLSFGTDTSLTTGPGWDNVTGLGTPNGASFVAAVAAAAAPAK